MITFAGDRGDAAVRLPLDGHHVIVLFTVFIELAAARGVVAVLRNPGSSDCRPTRSIC